MKILLLGANGQVGWELQRSLAPLGELRACGRKEADLENLDNLRTTIRDFGPSVIVNAAAYTAVDKAESEPDRAYRINAEAVGLLSDEAKHLDAWLIHYSTDYVFDGTKSAPYVETDPPNPLSVYGKTKLQGEEAIRASGCKHLIFRTSWVYAARGANFVKTMIRLAKERDELKVVADQFGVPTSAELIADITALALNRITTCPSLPQEELLWSSTYHLTPAGETSWHGFAKYALTEAQTSGIVLRTKPENVHPITTDEYPVSAKRPENSRLNTDKIIETFGVHLPPWQDHTQRLIMELVQQETQ